MSKRVTNFGKAVPGICLIGLLALTGCLGSTTPAPAGTLGGGTAPAAPDLTGLQRSVRSDDPISGDYIFYVRDGYLRTIKPDGTDARTVPLNEGQPLVVMARRDPGQAWRSPDGSRVAYLSGPRASLWVIGIDGSDNHLVAENLLSETESLAERSQIRRPLTQQNMAWSPDSQRLAFFGAPEDQWDLFIADLSGPPNPPTSGGEARRVVRVTEDRLKEEALSWSPDSQYLAFKSYSETEAFGETLYVVRADGSNRVAIKVSDIAMATGLPENSRFNYVGSLQWLDNETFALLPETTNASLGIWKGKIGTSALEPIIQQQIFGPVWSAEARRWAFVYRDDTGTIRTISPEGGEPQVIATDDARGPVWSPDGTRILYSKGPLEGTVWDIYVADADGGNARAIVKDVPLSQDGQPGPKGKRWWTPDGNGIVYVALGPAVENLWLVRLDGSPPKALTDFEEKTAFYLQPPRWSPDGRMLAFVGFSYLDTNLHLWVTDVNTSQVKMIEAGVFWFDWVKREIRN